MLRFRMAKGLVFIEGNKRLQLIRKMVNGNYQLESEDGEIVNITYEEILIKWRKLQWVIDINSLGQSAEIFYLSTPADFASLSLKDQKIIERKKHYIDFVKPEENKFNHKNWSEIIKLAAKEINDENPPEATTVLNWWKRYKNGKSIIGLLRLPKAKKELEKEPRYVFFEEVIKTLFLNKQKLKKINVVKEVNRLIKNHNEKNPSELIKKIATSTVYRWIENLEQDLVEASRLGAETARIKHRVSYGGLKIKDILERVELDHTPIDALVIDDETLLPLGRPWLSLLIDVSSRMILGFYISFNNPSAHSVLQALKMALMPKDGILAEYDVNGIWPAMGIPILLAVDNGMDLHSEGLKQACFEMVIQLMFMGAKSPFHKGTIERMIGTLNRELIHLLPGTVFSNVDERGEYDSENKATIDFKTLNKLILKWIVEIYHNRPHKGLLGKTPLEVWTEKSQGKVIELPANPQIMEVITGIPASRVIFHYGVELEGLHYNSRELQDIRRSIGGNPKIQLKFYEDQIGFIHVLNPNTNEFIRVDCVHPEFEQIHRHTYRLTRANARKRYGERHTIAQLLDSLKEIQDIISEAIKSKKMATRKFAAKFKSEHSKTSPQESNHELSPGLDDDLPEIPTNKMDDEK